MQKNRMIKKPKFGTSTKKKDKPTMDGYVFDSKLEFEYYLILKRLLGRNAIKAVKVHPRYTILVPFEKYGKKHRPILYEADFEITDLSGVVRVVDIKGIATRDAMIKRKMFDSQYEQNLEWIAFSRQDGGWIDYDLLQKIRRQRKRKNIDKGTLK